MMYFASDPPVPVCRMASGALRGFEKPGGRKTSSPDIQGPVTPGCALRFLPQAQRLDLRSQGLASADLLVTCSVVTFRAHGSHRGPRTAREGGTITVGTDFPARAASNRPAAHFRLSRARNERPLRAGRNG